MAVDLDDDIITLARATGPRSLRQAVARVKASYGVPETTAYAMIVRAAALCPSRRRRRRCPRSSLDRPLHYSGGMDREVARTHRCLCVTSVDGPRLRGVSSDAPETTVSPATSPRVVLARRIEFVLIGIGGVFIIGGWGFAHQEWARALGWLFTGVGFAIEMVYGRVLRASGSAEKKAEPPAAPCLR